MQPDKTTPLSNKCSGASPVERGIRVLAGSLITIGLILSYTLHPYWIILPAFVGLNLLQSGFTNFCPAEIILRRLLRQK